MDYIVYAAGITRECNAYGIVNMVGPQPGSEQECETLAGEIRAEHPGATVMVVPFGEYKSTANQFVVKLTGNHGKTGYYGPFPTKAGAEAGAASLQHGDEPPDLEPVELAEVVEVTAGELAELHVEAMPL